MSGMQWFLIVAVFLYFAPYLIAASRKHPHKAAIAALNLFLGWTLLGWVGALVWAYMPPPDRT